MTVITSSEPAHNHPYHDNLGGMEFPNKNNAATVESNGAVASDSYPKTINHTVHGPPKDQQHQDIQNVLRNSRDVAPSLVNETHSNNSEPPTSTTDALKSAPKPLQPRFSPVHTDPIVVEEWVFSSNNSKRKKKSQSNHTTTTHTHNHNNSAVPQTISVNHGPVIRGIPNYGQTCFLSSVLQSLASLTTFTVYLKSHVRSSSSYSLRGAALSLKPQQRQESFESSSGLYLTQLLWQGLQHINGRSVTGLDSNQKWDPRALLDIVGQSHKQFESTLHQQQDAQELLTALVDVLVQEQEFRRSLSPQHGTKSRHRRPWLAVSRRLPPTPETEPMLHISSYTPPALEWAMSPSFLRLQIAAAMTGETVRNEEKEADDEDTCRFHYLDDDDMLSVASSARETARFRRQRQQEEPFLTDRPHASNDKLNEESTATGKRNNKESKPLFPSNQQLHVANGGEEKKQDEVDLCAPLTGLEEDLVSTNALAVDEEAAETDVGSDLNSFSMSSSLGPIHSGDLSTTSSNFSSYRQPSLRTASARLAMPLSGWMGSTLQCRTCCYVRPIQNMPFVDISIIPTGVGRPYAVSKQNQPCTVEECLSDFTRVERVEQVDCPSCTKREYVRKAREEVEFWQFALADATALQQKKSHAASGGVASTAGDLDPIQKELHSHLQTLKEWQQINCDDADSATQIAKLLGVECGSDGKTPNVLFRRDASKCLFLTRLPPVMCLHIQRRYYDAQTARLSKTTQPVLFEEYLNVAPYCAYTTSQSGPTGRFQKHEATAPSWVAGVSSTKPSVNTAAPPLSTRKQRRQVFYRLMAVLEHHGGANSGHYVCYRRSSDGAWWYVSDHIVRSVSWQQVRQCQAYMLFYENCHLSEHAVP